MFELNAFVIRGHETVIDHYRWLRHCAISEMERQRLQNRMDEESEALHLSSSGNGAQRLRKVGRHVNIVAASLREIVNARGASHQSI
ncbi:hypothetical protein [Bradyrhizobium sp. LMTR 3]|uniref:hypothetical protein n=1 Tax=Bradyrhizobium sp. LMTR 3 TaxID=189873 RepID=UPI000810BEFA|nr:hypothetical protein [Bradyrhizobium sp. LMTR 3]OCK56542.1 hypothetical protein LMTR3_12785 [Bradyrhizobium sp. LMTR 3]